MKKTYTEVGMQILQDHKKHHLHSHTFSVQDLAQTFCNSDGFHNDQPLAFLAVSTNYASSAVPVQ